ncbi:MAG: hypothetical protein Q9188_000141 [Gyalolechia gomerana]
MLDPSLGFFYSPYAPQLFRSYGVQNIEKRYSAGGGSTNHTPGQATKLGDHDHVHGNMLNQTGMGTPHHQEKIGEQKPEKGSQFDKAWNKAQYGAEKGK